MEMKTGLQTTLQQRLAMTPRLQQALKLLQMPTLELQQVLKQALQENPMLEEVDDVVEAEDDAELKSQEETAQDDSKVDWDEFWNDTYDSSFRTSEQRSEDFWERVPVTKIRLSDLLENQLRQSSSSESEIEIGGFIIGCIDDDGYMRVPLDEVARDLGVDVEGVEKALALIQTFDPAGVGARSREECLLIQLRTHGIPERAKLPGGLQRIEAGNRRWSHGVLLTKALVERFSEARESATDVGANQTGRLSCCRGCLLVASALAATGLSQRTVVIE